MRSRPLAWVLGPLLVVGVACGRDPGSGSSGTGRAGAAAPAVDRSSPDTVWKAAHAALAAGDLARLLPCLTDAGARRLARDLEAWRGMLTDPATGPRVAARVRLPDDPAARAEAQTALAGGDTAALLRLYVASDPRESWVPLPARSGAVGDVLDVEVPARGGETRPVRLVRGDDGWRIDRLVL